MQLLKNWVNHTSIDKLVYGVWFSFNKHDIGGGLCRPIRPLTLRNSNIHTFTSETPEGNMMSYRRFSEKFPEQLNAFKTNLK